MSALYKMFLGKVVWALLHCKSSWHGLSWFDMKCLDMDMEQRQVLSQENLNLKYVTGEG